MLKFLKQDVIAKLEENIEINMKNYINTESIIQENDYLESNIFYKEINLIEKVDKELFDLENTKILYEALKGLSPLQASDGRIWVGMTHSKKGMSYAKKRWNITENTTISSLKTRYFTTDLRNSYSRLWWYGYVSYDENLENPWELTEILLSNQNLVVGIMERSFSRNKNFVQNFLRALKNVKDKHEIILKGDKIRRIAKAINRKSAVTIVDLISVEDFEIEILKVCK